MTNAPYDGTYMLDGHHFRMRAGAPLPPGAEPMPDPNAAPEPEPLVEEAPSKRSKGSAPENRAKAGKAEKR